MLSKVCAGALLRDKSDRLGLHLVHGGGVSVEKLLSRSLWFVHSVVYTVVRNAARAQS